MKHGKLISAILFISLMVALVAVWGRYEASAASKQGTRPEGWTEKTHGSSVEPNYKVVFPQDRVNKIKITIRPDDWERMQANLNELLGGPGRGLQGRRPGGRGDMTQDNPIYVPATIEFNGLTWTHVGVRYKGNSSLRSSWRNGILKLPMKLDFDEFDNEYTEINDQRFYGFQQLSLSNSFHDSTYMREKIANDILAEAGLVAAETSYYEVTMDYGKGPVDLGLYVMIEVIDDTVINRFFGNDSGNIYKPSGEVSLAKGTFDRIHDSFVKKNNIGNADWGDIEELYNVLHSETRTSDPESWRKSLESIFDVDVFLEWLAISAVIQNWDNYGSMSHNFYIYHDPESGLLKWISWDHNEVLGSGGGGRRGMGGNASLGRKEIGENWPLIRYLLDDPIYYDRYTGYIEETLRGAFYPDKIEEKCRRLAGLIEPYATKDSGKIVFESALQDLISHIHERFDAAKTFLAAGR